MNKTIQIKEIDKTETYRYLAYGCTLPDSRVSALIEESEPALITALKPNYIYRTFDIENITENEVTLKSCTMKLQGKDIASHLKDCQKAVLLCATVGADVDKLIRISQIEDMAKAVVIDTMASVAIEMTCNEIEKIIKTEYKDFFMTWRYSAGYGDFPIETQKAFTEILNSYRSIGVCTTDSYLLTPKKSVTAVIGLSISEIAREKKGCISCNLKDSCTFRKRGMHCE